MSECAKFYFAALACPFLWVDESCELTLKDLNLPMDRENPCIPLIPNLKSRKFYGFARGTFQCSTGATSPGSGWIVYAPNRIASDGALDLQSPPILFTNAAYNFPFTPPAYPATLDSATPLPAGILSAYLNTDYAPAELVLVAFKGIKYRVVGGGVRVRYTGTEVNRAGTLHCIVHPNHDSLGTLEDTDIGQYETYFRMPVTRKWTYLAHSPVMEEDFKYQPDFPNNPALYGTVFSTANNQHFIGFMVTDCLLGSFEFEVITHFEAIGSLVRGLTPTPVDMTGASVVLNVAATADLAEFNKTSNVGSLLKDGLSAISTVIPEAKILSDVVNIGSALYEKFS